MNAPLQKRLQTSLLNHDREFTFLWHDRANCLEIHDLQCIISCKKIPVLWETHLNKETLGVSRRVSPTTFSPPMTHVLNCVTSWRRQKLPDLFAFFRSLVCHSPFFVSLWWQNSITGTVSPPASDICISSSPDESLLISCCQEWQSEKTATNEAASISCPYCFFSCLFSWLGSQE